MADDSGLRRRRGAAGDGAAATAHGGREDVQARATASAWRVPAHALAGVLGTPIVVMLARVAALDQWIALQLGTCVAVSAAAYLLTCQIIPWFGERLVDKLAGVDIGKRGLGGAGEGKRIPESLGVVSSTVFMVSVGLLQFCFGAQNDQLLEYNAALLSICFATLLGLVDDLVDLKWRYKVPVGFFMSLPLLLSYKGVTSILLPKSLAPLLAFEPDGDAAAPPLTRFLNALPTVSVDPSGHLLDLGMVYYLYMMILVVFCTNAINIYAGINGIEVGQSIVVACSIVVMNLMDLAWRGGSAEDVLSGDGRHHLFSAMLMLPFIATSAGLLRFNWYPARVFVGDVYPYYAGMTIATAAVLGHFSKSLLLLIVPQLLNTAYSLPQLFHLVPIPRHRLPRVNTRTGLMEASKVAEGDPRTNMTLLCAALRIFGPMHERTLCVVLLLFQLACAAAGLALRYVLSGAVF